MFSFRISSEWLKVIVVGKGPGHVQHIKKGKNEIKDVEKKIYSLSYDAFIIFNVASRGE